VKNVFYRKDIQLPGANCSIYGCRTSRKHFGVSIFRIPTKDDDLSTKIREEFARLVTKDAGSTDRCKFTKSNAQQTVHVRL
jgi:hypothetical protein